MSIDRTLEAAYFWSSSRPVCTRWRLAWSWIHCYRSSTGTYAAKTDRFNSPILLVGRRRWTNTYPSASGCTVLAVLAVAYCTEASREAWAGNIRNWPPPRTTHGTHRTWFHSKSPLQRWADRNSCSPMAWLNQPSGWLRTLWGYADLRLQPCSLSKFSRTFSLDAHELHIKGWRNAAY